MRSASSTSAAELSVRCSSCPSRRAQTPRTASRWAASRAEIGVAQVLRARREHGGEPAGCEKLGVARERVGLLDRIDDHHEFAVAPSALDGPDRPRDLFGSERKSPIRSDHRSRRDGQRRRQRGLRSAASRSSVAIASAKRSMTPRAAIGRVSPSRPTRSPPRTQRSASASASTAARSIFVPARVSSRKPSTPSGRTRSRPYAPPPIRARARKRGPRAPSAASRRARRLARYERAKLPEGLARTGPPAPVDAVHHALRDPARGDDEARQTGRERRGRPRADGGAGASWRRWPPRHRTVFATRRAITAEIVSPSARAANVSAMRCLSTGSASAATSSREGDEPAVDQRPGAGRQHQRLRGARSRTPGDPLGQFRIAFARARRAHEIEDRLDDAVADRRPPNEALRRQQVLRGHRRLGHASRSPVVSIRMRRSAARSG